ncbi:MAG: 30S ribosomal protein S8 [Minisyncoccia bacterium]
MITDPIGDLFARIKNNWKVKKERFVVPYSKVKVAILKIFKEKNIVKDFKVKEEGNKKFLIVYLNYLNDEPPYEDIIRVSKPSRRVYFKVKDLKPVRQGFGFRIISTSRGIMLDNEAKKRKLGGEVICEVI